MTSTKRKLDELDNDDALKHVKRYIALIIIDILFNIFIQFVIYN